MHLLIPGIGALGSIREDPRKPYYPPEQWAHAGTKVPIGGSNCSNCEYLTDDQKHCRNQNFIAWEGPNKPAGDDKIPGEIDAYCSIWWEPKDKEPDHG